jgi:hypothetical protein
MLVLKKKTRIITFRLSEEEFQQLLSASVSRGARSVSDYARDVLFRELQNNEADHENQALHDRVDRLASELQSLNIEINYLRRRVLEPLLPTAVK